MTSDQLRADAVLKFEIAADARPDAEVIARALVAWVETVKAAMVLLDPEGDARVELVGVEAGSQVFLVAIKRIQAASQEYPLVAKAAGTLATAITGALITVAVTPEARIPDDQMAVFKEMNANTAASLAIQRQRQDFYSIIEAEPAITAIEVQDPLSRQPFFAVPRADFSYGAGLFSLQELEPSSKLEPRVVDWDVVLIRPALVAKPRRWTFSRDGLEFSATMDDPAVLAAMKKGTLPLRFVEGGHMKIRLEYKERREGDIWRVVGESRKVTQVLDPLPPVPATPLFPSANLP